MPPQAHAAHGASKAARWMRCPGSINLSEGIAETTSRYATEGTAAHDLVERCLHDGVDASSFVGSTIPVGDTMVPATEEMAAAVQVFVDHVESLTTDTRPLLETRFDLAPLDPPAPMFGTADVVIWREAESHLHVLDYKHGVGVSVDATGNEQLLMYALGAVVHLGIVPEHITVWIGQPRGHHADGPIRCWTLDWATLVDFKRELFLAAAATLAPDAPLNPGSWCRFCPALPTCPAQRAEATAVTRSSFDVPGPVAPDALPAPERLSVEDISLVLDKADIVARWLKSVQVYAHKLLERGEEVPGYKLIAGRGGNRRWIDAELAGRYLAGRKLKVNERHTRKLISPAQAEKLLTDVPQRLWERPAGRTKVVPDSDARRGLVVESTMDFVAGPPPHIDATEVTK